MGQSGSDVAALRDFETKGGSEAYRFMDKLLVCALIEARSCERFKRLSEGLMDPHLRDYYRYFMEGEASHYHVFIGLADHYMGKEVTRVRWCQWLEYEVLLLKKMDPRGDLIHG